MEPVIDCSFPGGNIVFEGIDGDTVYLHQDLRDTSTDWFYWYFRIRGAGGRRLKFAFTRSRAIGAVGAGVSRDGGVTWVWTGRDCVKGNSFVHEFGLDDNDVRFSFGMPYQASNLTSFLAGLAGSSFLKQEVLCRSRKGREVEKLRFGCLDRDAKYKILITCRHHCCEMMANYVLEGMIESILDGVGEFRWLRDNVEFAAIPFVDKDGVEDGDQGKNRTPHDHNRDYGDDCIYPEIRAIRDQIPAWAGDRFSASFDLHCPYIDGLNNDRIYMVGLEEDNLWREQCRFAGCVESLRKGPLIYRASDNMEFGREWNTAKGMGKPTTNSSWAKAAGAGLLGIFEFPYALSSGQEVNQSSAKAFGRDLARGLQAYLSG